jgi:hypothetical protein
MIVLTDQIRSVNRSCQGDSVSISPRQRVDSGKSSDDQQKLRTEARCRREADVDGTGEESRDTAGEPLQSAARQPAPAGIWPLTVFALLLSICSVVVAVVAVGIARNAAAKAEDAERTAAIAPQATTGPPVGPTSAPTDGGYPTVPDEGPDSPFPSPGTEAIIPEANYQLAYDGEVLRIPAPPEGLCIPGFDEQQSLYVDLDEPRVGTTEVNAEFEYTPHCARQKWAFDFEPNVPFSTVSSAQATARDCANSIRSQPITGPVVPQPGTILCLVTSASAAEKQGIPQKLVLLDIRNVAKDGTVNLAVRAWDVPH